MRGEAVRARGSAYSLSRDGPTSLLAQNEGRVAEQMVELEKLFVGALTREVALRGQEGSP